MSELLCIITLAYGTEIEVYEDHVEVHSDGTVDVTRDLDKIGRMYRSLGDLLIAQRHVLE